MKVDGNESVNNLRSLQNAKADIQVSKTTRKQENGPGGDQVQLSDRAREFQRIKDVLKDVPDTRDEKVADLKAAITKGTYQADPGKTSENLIQESLIDLLV